MALAGASALNAPSLGLARLLRRLAASDIAYALLADTRHAPAVRAASALLECATPNDGSGGGFRLAPPRPASATSDEADADGGRGASAEVGPILPLLELMAAAEDELLAGGVRCSQLHGSPPCAASHIVGSAAILRFVDCLASGRGLPALDSDVDAAMPSCAPLLARAISEVCNFESVRRIARCARACARWTPARWTPARWTPARWTPARWTPMGARARTRRVMSCTWRVASRGGGKVVLARPPSCGPHRRRARARRLHHASMRARALCNRTATRAARARVHRRLLAVGNTLFAGLLSHVLLSKLRAGWQRVLALRQEAAAQVRAAVCARVHGLCRRRARPRPRGRSRAGVQ